MTTKGFDISIFSLMNQFAAGEKTMKQAWINKDHIMFNLPRVKSLLYNPPSMPFDDEFGINDLPTFASMLSLFGDSLQIKLEGNDIIMSSSDSSQVIVFRTSAKTSFETISDGRPGIIQSNQKAHKLHLFSEQLENEGRTLSFDLTSDIMNRILKASSILSQGNIVKSTLTIVKEKGSSDIDLVVKNESSENIFALKVPCVNSADIEEYRAVFLTNQLLPGNWKVFLYPEKIEIDGTEREVSWIRMVDSSRHLAIINTKARMI